MSGPKSYVTNDERWQAVLGRDPRADGQFVYAVRTTNVYCRTSCGSRRPKRTNVEFFSNSSEAERRGFRPCKKCRPQVRAATGWPAAVSEACRLMEEAESAPSLAELSRAVGLSSSYFHRLFKQTVGITPRAYSASRRAARLRAGLQQGRTVSEALYAAGYGSSSRCYEAAEQHLGMTPAQYRRGGAGQTIRLAVAECRLGWVAVAATERGLCAIELGDDPAQLRAELTERFARADVQAADAELAAWLGRVAAHIAAPVAQLQLPLDVRGTVFQRRVWEELRRVPAGATTTYGELAERLGKPGGARAVARACATNPLAVAIPCHRVVRQDGAESGYRWGLERKRQLLDSEAAAAEEPHDDAANSAN